MPGMSHGNGKGTHMDVNLSNIVMVYSAVVVVMMRIVHRQV